MTKVIGRLWHTASSGMPRGFLTCTRYCACAHDGYKVINTIPVVVLLISYELNMYFIWVLIIRKKTSIESTQHCQNIYATISVKYGFPKICTWELFRTSTYSSILEMNILGSKGFLGICFHGVARRTAYSPQQDQQV